LNLSSLVSVFLSIVAVACVYLFFLNRILIQLRDARHKSWLIRAGGLTSLCIGAALGYLATGTLWLLLPIAVLLITALGELQRWLIRRRCRGAAPVEVENGGVSWRKPNTTTDFALARYAVNVPSWRGPALRIAHISDLHLNSHLPLAYYERVMHRVADAQPDLIFFTGDFVTDPQYVNLLPSVLTLARGRLGTFGVLGNHDYWADPAAVAETVGTTGVTLLRDAAVRVPIGEGRHILIAGADADPHARQRLSFEPAGPCGYLCRPLPRRPDSNSASGGFGGTIEIRTALRSRTFRRQQHAPVRDRWGWLRGTTLTIVVPAGCIYRGCHRAKWLTSGFS
jgi:hypothetical protein